MEMENEFVPYHVAIGQFLRGEISLAEFLAVAIIPHGHDEIIEALGVYKTQNPNFDPDNEVKQAVLAQKAAAEKKAEEKKQAILEEAVRRQLAENPDNSPPRVCEASLILDSRPKPG